MGLVDFASLSVCLNLIIFSVAVAVIWFAGTRLSRYADEISKRTELSKAFPALWEARQAREETLQPGS